MKKVLSWVGFVTLVIVVSLFTNILLGPGITPVGTLKPGTAGYILQSGATYSEWFNWLGTANVFTIGQKIDPSGTGVDGLEVDMPSSTTGDAITIEYNTATRAFLEVDADETNLVLSDVDLGNDVAGSYVQVGRNTNGTSAGTGHIRLVDRSGTTYYLHPADDGTLRWGTTIPIGSADTTNPEVGGSASGTVIGDVRVFNDNDTGNSGTWYQNLNLTSSGYIDEILVTRLANTADYTGLDCNIRINIDGGGAQTLETNNIGSTFSSDDVYIGYDGTYYYAARRIMLGGVRFETSVDIDVMQDSGGTKAIYHTVHYREDQ